MGSQKSHCLWSPSFHDAVLNEQNIGTPEGSRVIASNPLSALEDQDDLPEMTIFPPDLQNLVGRKKGKNPLRLQFTTELREKVFHNPSYSFASSLGPKIPTCMHRIPNVCLLSFSESAYRKDFSNVQFNDLCSQWAWAILTLGSSNHKGWCWFDYLYPKILSCKSKTDIAGGLKRLACSIWKVLHKELHIRTG